MAKIIMVQGTASGVGKSVLSTGLCRILKQDGFRVAPFKAQNMSANCHTLANGHLMARSQAIAAYACGLLPSVDMNPILLMPDESGQTRVVLNGEHRGKLTSLGQGLDKSYAFQEALAAFYRLDEAYDFVVIEGAGSPVEMNLIKDDLVNMGLAEKINAPVLLVADIDRGGVFAALYGTMMLFTPAQKALVKGLVINKFRGELDFFADGKKIIETLCGKPVVGIVPHTEIRLEDEDNLPDYGHAIKTQSSFFSNDLPQDDERYLAFLDGEFDRLADFFRQYLDLEAIFG